MSLAVEEKTRVENEIEDATAVDVESYDFKNDLFRKTYGAETSRDADTRGLDMAANNVNDHPRRPNQELVNKGLHMSTNARLSVFDREKVFPSDWTEGSLDLLESWYAACKKSSASHAQAARDCRTKHRLITIPTIVLSTVATSLSFFSAGNSCDTGDDDANGLLYGVAELASSVSIMGGISALYNFSSKMQENINASGNFQNLARRAQIQIYLPMQLRAHSELTLESVALEFAHLTTNSPLL